MQFRFSFFIGLLGIEVTCIYIRAVCLQQKLDGFHEVKTLQFLHKANDVATFTTAETLIHVQREVKHQRGRLLVMEDTTAFLVVLTGILKRSAWT